jgi:DNA-binding MarR family transcriptional regulator
VRGKTDKCKNSKALFEETSLYLDNIRRLPQVRAFFWILRCADAFDKYTQLQHGRKGYGHRTMIAVLQFLLAHPEGTSQQSIAKNAGRTKQLVVLAIDKLEKAGYAVRKSHVSDRRVNTICITDAGVEYLKAVAPQNTEICNQALSPLSDAEIEQLLPIMIKLTKGMSGKLGSNYSDTSFGRFDPD